MHFCWEFWKIFKKFQKKVTKNPWRIIFSVLICKRNQETNGLQIKQLIIFPLIIASGFGCFTRGRLHFYGISERLTVSAPQSCQLMYHQYIRVAILWMLPCHSSHWCHKNNSFKNPRRITAAKPVRYKITYHQYVWFVSDVCFLVLHPFWAIKTLTNKKSDWLRTRLSAPNEHSVCIRALRIVFCDVRIKYQFLLVILSEVEGSSVAKNQTIAPDKFLLVHISTKVVRLKL